MIKDHFMDAFLQISIILSLLKSDYQDVTLFNHLNTLRDSFHGQLAVSPIIDFHSINGRNPDLGFVHPKNARIEDVLRSVHSLGRFGRFREISSDVVNAFLVDETPNAFSSGNGNGGNNAGRPSAGGDNTLPHSNSPLTQGEEPTKEDMDLIDVLWRHDIDLGVSVEPPLMWELEKEQELNLHKRLEEEAIALIKLEDSQPSDNPVSFDSCVQDATRTCGTWDVDTGECSTASEELNTPEILDNPGFSLFHEQNTQDNIESDWANLMNLIGVENNLDGDVEGEMFSNLFAFNDNRDGDDNDAEQLKMEGGEEESPSSGLENMDFPMYGDPLLEEEDAGLFDGLGTDLNTWLGMEDLNIEFDGFPDLTEDEDDSSSSVAKGLSGGKHTPRSSCLSTTDPSCQEMFSRDESIFSPSEGKYSMSDRVSSRCSFSSDSLLAGCTRSSSVWADSTDIHHNHTYDNKLHLALSQELCFKEEKEHKPTMTFTKDYFPKEKQTTRPTRSRDEVKLKQMKIPFSLDEIINRPIEWFTDVTTNPKFHFTPQQVDLLRSIRKRGKNKEAAQNCRKRKLDEIQSLEMEVDALSAQRMELAKNCGSLENNIDKLARKFTELQERILVCARRSNQKFGDGDVSLHFDCTGVIRLVDGSQRRQQQLDEWDSVTTPDNSNRKTAKTKRKQAKRN